MTLNQLATKLHDMYSNAPAGEKVTMIHLFGIIHHHQIKEFSVQEVIEQSSIRASYATELSKAVKLAKYVKAKTTDAL